MEDNNDMQWLSRLQIFNKLVMRYSKDYDTMIKHYTHAEKIEITEHLQRVTGYISEYYKTKDEKYWQQYADAETELLKKYRSKLQPYAHVQFRQYYDSRKVLALKDIVPIEELNAMKNAAEQSLSDEEFEDFLHDTKRYLSTALYFLYLDDTGETEANVTLNDTESVTDEPDKGITKARQLLAIYYFLKASLGISRASTDVAGIARFIHLLTGTKYTSLQSSDIYKKFRRMPNYKSNAKLIEDLDFIRPYFAELELDSALKMIDAEREIAVKQLPIGEKKKYDLPRKS